MTLFLAAAGALALLQGKDAVPEPKAILQRAEALAAEERFDEARMLYKKLADKFAGTPEGEIGARRSQPSAFLGWKEIVRNGPSSNRVDVVLMGDGYTLEHMKAFDKLAEDVPRLFEHQRTFREYLSYFDFLRADLLSAEDGIDGFGRHFDTALGGKTLGTIAGHVGIDGARARAMLSEVPGNDGLAIVFVKQGILGTGGGGIAVIGGMSAPTVIHEWGHAFAGLSDEYDVQQSVHPGSVRSGINVSDTDDPKLVPWAHWIAAKVPGIGVYQGASGHVRGAWKPTATGCVMDHSEFFCPVCQEAIVLRIYSIVDPVDGCEPPPPPAGIREPIDLGEAPVEFRVRPMQPATHELEVRWWVIPTASLPETRGAPKGAPGDRARTSVEAKKSSPAPASRAERGPLPLLPGRPHATTRPNAEGVHVLRLRAADFPAGRYEVICRVRDATQMFDEKWPWVLKDDRGLLESERAWWVRVPEKR